MHHDLGYWSFGKGSGTLRIGNDPGTADEPEFDLGQRHHTYLSLGILGEINCMPAALRGV